MTRLILLAIILLYVLIACSPNTDDTVNTYVVGIVNPVVMREPVVEAFIAGMHERGYREGDTIRYLYDGAIVDPDERAAWVAELVAAEVDLIIAIATPGAIDAKAGTDTIPIVFFPVTDPVGAGLVDSLQAPGGNATGVTNGNPHPLRLQFLVELVPDIDTIYAPYDATNPAAVNTKSSVMAAAEALGIEMIAPQVVTDDEILASLDEIPEEADAIFAMPDPRVADHWQTWSEMATERGIVYSSLSYAEVMGGSLMAYGEELDAVGKQAARMADQILRGTAPADIPVETANYFLSINLETAQRSGITVPDTILQRATFIIHPSSQSSDP